MEPGAAELYDQALLGILQHVGNVQDFLRVLFGFLYRKTDFYRLLRHPSDRMGFPPGAAQALVLQVRWGAAAGRWDPAGPYPRSTSRRLRCPGRVLRLGTAPLRIPPFRFCGSLWDAKGDFCVNGQALSEARIRCQKCAALGTGWVCAGDS